MKSLKSKVLVVGITTTMISITLGCNSTQNNIEKEVTGSIKETKELIAKNTIVADKYVGKLDELLTLEMAAEAAGLPAAEAQKSPSTAIEKKYNKISIKYSWKNDAKLRTVEVMKQTITTPVDDYIELSWVKNTTLAHFKQQNTKPTEADKAKAKDAISSKTDALQKDEGVTKEAATTANDIAQNAIDSYSVAEVPNLGEYALFTNTKFAGVMVRELKVFYKGLSFQLIVDVDNDSRINDAKAIALAKKIINEKLK